MVLRRSSRIAARNKVKPVVAKSAAMGVTTSAEQNSRTTFVGYFKDISALITAIKILDNIGSSYDSLLHVKYELYRYIYSGDVIDVIRENSQVLLNGILDCATRMLDQLNMLAGVRELTIAEEKFTGLLLKYSWIRNY